MFSIAGEEFGIKLDRVLEIIRPTKATLLPRVPAFIEGVINLRGTVLPLMDLRKRLRVDPLPQRERIIISIMHGERMGLLVDSVKEIIDIEEEQISPTPSIFQWLRPEYISGIGKSGKRLIVILDLDAILTTEEMSLLGERKEEWSTEDEPGNPDDEKELKSEK